MINKLAYIAAPYLFLMFLVLAAQDAIRAAICATKNRKRNQDVAHRAYTQPYAHECVDRPHLTCPACAASGQTYVIPLCGPNMGEAIPVPNTGDFENLKRRASKGQSLVEVCAMLAVLLVLAVGARHLGMHVLEALRDVVTVTHGTN